MLKAFIRLVPYWNVNPVTVEGTSSKYPLD